jgi:predicted AlkP superfamily pyrophosphatase or phosphodiesterase
MVTGLYAENHGIVANTMYDAELDSRFSLSNRDAVGDGRWWGGEPIWVTAEKDGLKTSPLFWPGSEAEIAGYRPTYWKRFYSQFSYRERVEDLLSKLELPGRERPSFLCTYFALADTAGHNHGTDSPELIEAIEQLDRTIGDLIQGLKEREILHRVNLLVVSDHGMTDLDVNRIIFLDDYLDSSKADIVDWNPVAAVQPHPGSDDQVYASLKDAHPNLRVFKRQDIPARFRFRNNPRVTPIIAIADEGWTITTRSFFEDRGRKISAASHGYDNLLKSMQGVFIAHGSAFRRGAVIEPFINIHLYPLMARILGVEPAPNDGSLDKLKHVLKPSRLR